MSHKKQGPVTVTKVLPDGTRKYYRGNTKKEAEAKRDKDVEFLSKGLELDNPTIEELGKIWFNLVKDNKEAHVRTKETIQGTLRRYVYPSLGKKGIKDLRPVDVRNMMKRLSTYSKSIQNKVLQAIRGICNFAVENNFIDRTPVPLSLKAGGAAPEEIVPLTDDQCTTLLQALKGTRAYLFVELLLFTGLRKGEALGLMWKDIDFRTAILHVERSVVYPVGNQAGEINPELKTSAARRSVPLVPVLLADLVAEKAKSKSLYVFSMGNGKFLSESSFRRMWDLVSYRSTKTEGRIDRTIDFDVHPHLLRHTCVTRWIEGGMDVKEVQYLAGHASPDVTMRIYAHYRRDQRLEGTAAKMRAIAEL